MVVHKDIFLNHPASWAPTNPLIMRTGTLKAESSIGSEDDVVRVPTKEGGASQKVEFAGRQDNADNVFIEDVRGRFLGLYRKYANHPGYRSSARSHHITLRPMFARSSRSTRCGSCALRHGMKRMRSARQQSATLRPCTPNGQERSRVLGAAHSSPMIRRSRRNLRSTRAGSRRGDAPSATSSSRRYVVSVLR